MGIFRIAKRFRVKHEILSYLHSKLQYNENHIFNTNDSISSLEEIAKGTGIPFSDVVKYHHLINDSEAKCLPTSGKNKEHKMIIDRAGIDAVIERKWIREGNKELNERIYDRTKWVLPLLAILLTVASLWYSVYTIQRTTQRIASLQKDVTVLTERVRLLTDTTNRNSPHK